jgi:hypothetical protein
MLTTRQGGKSQTAAALALRTALLHPGALVLLLSPVHRQSAELCRKVIDLYAALGRPVPLAGPRGNVLKLELANGSRIVSLPGKGETIRGFSGVSLLVVDEAAWVPDATYRAVRPFLAVSRGRLVALSTPNGKRGWFFEAWENGAEWHKVKVTAPEVARISPEFLAEERAVLGPRWFASEYMCSFEDMEGAVIPYELIMRAFSHKGVKPLEVPW